MTADTLSSASITALDIMTAGTGPIAIPTAGQGSPNVLYQVGDYVTPTTAGLADTGSKYKLIRLSPEVKVKSIELFVSAAIETSTCLAIDLGAYYSDSTVDGTPAALQGTSISVNAFGAILTGLRSSFIGKIDGAPTWSAVNRNKRLWEALGLSSNPGGNIDIVAAVHTAATGAVSVALGVDIKFTK